MGLIITPSGLVSAQLGAKTVDYNMAAVLTFYVKSIAVLTTGTPADIATITLPAGITRWRSWATAGSGAPSMMVTETAAGTIVAGTMAMFDAAAGGGNQMLATTAPGASANTVNTWAISSSGFSTSASMVIRQMANSANAGTISFYIVVVPLL